MQSWGRAFQTVGRQEAVEDVVRRLDFIPSAAGSHWRVLSLEACDLIYFVKHGPSCRVEEEVGGWRKRWEAGEEPGAQARGCHGPAGRAVSNISSAVGSASCTPGPGSLHPGPSSSPGLSRWTLWRPCTGKWG